VTLRLARAAVPARLCGEGPIRTSPHNLDGVGLKVG